MESTETVADSVRLLIQSWCAFASGTINAQGARQVIAILALLLRYTPPFCHFRAGTSRLLLVEVQDSSGGAIPAAQITLATKIPPRVFRSQRPSGEVHSPRCLPSTYSLEVTQKVSQANATIVISISARPSIRFVLAPESLRQSVEVAIADTRQPSARYCGAATVQTVITADDIDEIPSPPAASPIFSDGAVYRAR